VSALKRGRGTAPGQDRVHAVLGRGTAGGGAARRLRRYRGTGRTLAVSHRQRLRPCRGTGYRGRKAIAETLILNDEMRELISSRQPVRAVKEAARKLVPAACAKPPLIWSPAGKRPSRRSIVSLSWRERVRIALSPHQWQWCGFRADSGRASPTARPTPCAEAKGHENWAGAVEVLRDLLLHPNVGQATPRSSCRAIRPLRRAALERRACHRGRST